MDHRVVNELHGASNKVKRRRKVKPRELHKLLCKHESLKDSRNPMFERNRFVKWLGILMIAYYAAIMIFMGVLLPIPMSEIYAGVPAFHVIDGYFWTLLIADFWLRFIVQDTPANQARPYSLLPISRKFMMRRYLVRAGLSWGNLFWGFFLVPFAFLSVFPLFGLGATMGWLIGWWLLFILNGYIYLFFRALSMKSMWWILLPLLIHVGVSLIAFVPDHNILDMPCTYFMYDFALWKPIPYIAMLVLLAIGFVANEKLQSRMLYEEVGKKEDVKITKSQQWNFLNKYGVFGEYLKLEIKMRMRNKMPKMQFITLLCMMVLLSVLLYFTDIYDNTFMKSFICMYDYIVLGMTSLITIMAYEGNYMDLLMSRKQGILDLLTTKYYLNSVLLLIPLLLTTPLMFIGKISVWMDLGYLFFTVGVLYPVTFQMAVYNKETLPLNAKLTGKQGNSKQNIVSMVLMFGPLLIERISVILLGDVYGYLLLISMGIIGIATHKRWLKWTYNRFMARRYENMEGFRASLKG